MFRDAIGVSKPLCLALSLGGLAGVGSVAMCERFGLALSASAEAFPVIGCVVLFGFRGAVGSGRRLASLLRERYSRAPPARPWRSAAPAADGAPR